MFSSANNSAVATMPKTNTETLGVFHDQEFHAIEHVAGAKIQFPFAAKSFSVFIDIPVPPPEAVLRETVLRLLRHGMRSAVCWGYEAELIGDMINSVIDEYGFWLDDHTAFCSVHEEEDLAEAMEYFILPTGLTDTSLLLTLSDQQAFTTMVDTFKQITQP